MGDRVEYIRQLCSMLTEEWDGFPDGDEEFELKFKEKYPLLNYDFGWKTHYFELADTLYEINHPQANKISRLLYNAIFCRSNFIISGSIFKVIFDHLKNNTCDIIKEIE